MRNRFLLPLVLFVAAVFIGAGVSGAGEGYGKEGYGKERGAYSSGGTVIKLSAPSNVKTTAGGKATFKLGADGKTLHYSVNVTDLENATMGHIHEVKNGVPGAVLAWLYPATGEAPSLREGKLTGTLSEGDLAADKLRGEMKGKSVKELAEMLGLGKAGVAIHTKQNPGGELWGFGEKKM